MLLVVLMPQPPSAVSILGLFEDLTFRVEAEREIFEIVQRPGHGIY